MMESLTSTGSNTQAWPFCSSTPPLLAMQHTDAGFTNIIGRCTRFLATVDAGTSDGCVLDDSCELLGREPLCCTSNDVQVVILPQMRLGMTTDGNVNMLVDFLARCSYGYIWWEVPTVSGPTLNRSKVLLDF